MRRAPCLKDLTTLTLVTIDFHNTLFRCDDWFRLEIERLPVAVIESLQPEIGDRDPSQLRDDALGVYREIRRTAMDTGVECDADSSMYQVFQRLHLDIPASRVRNAVRSVMWATVNTARPRCGAQQLIKTLHERQIPLAVVSSAAYHPFLEWCLERHDMRSAFAHVVTSASCGIYKSDPRIYQHTMSLFTSRPESSVHIGDSHRFDVTSAAKVGMRTILLTDDSEGAFNPAPDAVITTLGEAVPQLDKLLRK